MLSTEQTGYQHGAPRLDFDAVDLAPATGFCKGERLVGRCPGRGIAQAEAFAISGRMTRSRLFPRDPSQ